jgi:tetratricopeptide (TPR) repeat protein
MNRVVQRFTAFTFFISTSALMYAQQPEVRELRFPANTIVAFHLAEPYGSCAVDTHFKVRISGPVDPNTNTTGDAVAGVLTLPLTCNGQTVLPASTRLEGRFVAFVAQSGSDKDSYDIELRYVNATAGAHWIHAVMDSKQTFATALPPTGPAAKRLMNRPGATNTQASTRPASGASKPNSVSALAANEDAEKHRKLALAQLKSGNLERAVAELRLAVRLDETNPSYHFVLGDVLLKKRDYNGTIAEWQRGFQLQPGMASSEHQALAKSLYKRGDLDGSINEFRKAAQLAPDDIQNHENLAAALARKGDTNGEIGQFREIERISPGDLANHKRLAVSLLKQKKYAYAKQEFREVLPAAPRSAEVHAGLGAAEAGLGNYDAAQSELRQALRIDPQNLLAQRQLRTISQLQAQQQQQQAAQAAARAAARNAASCDPNWSSRFDSLTNDPAGMRAAIQDKLDGYVVQYGGYDGAIQEVQSEIQSDQARDDLTPDQLQALVSMNQGIIEILHCRQSRSQVASAPQESAPARSYTPGASSGSTGQTRTYIPGQSSDACPLPGDGTGVTVAMAQACVDSGGSAAGGSSTHTYTPGSSSSGNNDNEMPAVYTPGSPAGDTSMGMLDTGGNLKPAYLGMTSDYSAVTDQNQSSCDATVHVTLLGSQLGADGASLQFQASVQPNPSSPAVPAGCFELEYTIQATQRLANGDPGPAAGQTFHTKFADASDTDNIALPVSSTGSNGIDLVGWRVVGALCHRAAKCAAKLSPAECARLQDYRQNVLPNGRLALIKQFGITSIGKDGVRRMRLDLLQLMKDADFATSDLASFLIDLETATSLIQDVGRVLAPQGELRNLAVLVGPKPSLTARQVLGVVERASDAVSVVRTVNEESAKEAALELGKQLLAKWNPVYAVLKDMQDNAKQHAAQNTLIQTLNGQMDDLDQKIDDYNQTLQQLLDQENGLKQISDGIDLACDGEAPNDSNP